MQIELVLAGLFVFCMRVTDMSLDTVRLLFTVRGRKLVAGAIGVVQAGVFILAVSRVLSGPLNPYTVAGYALGFGTGVMLGIVFEERLAVGYAMLRIYSNANGMQIAEQLRASGHAATEILARGREGNITVVNCVVARRNVTAVRAVVDALDANAFVTIDDARPLQHGYFRH